MLVVDTGSLPVDDESSKLLTFTTPWGRYRFTKLPFGISSAPEIYQREIDKLFEGIPVEIIVDDFLINGKDQTDADQKLRRVLDRNREVGLKFNPKEVKLCSWSKLCWTCVLGRRIETRPC